MRKATRLFYWPRKLAIGLIILIVAISLGSAALPKELTKSWFHPVKYQGELAAASARYNLDPYLVAAIIQSESSWDPSAKSQVGALGLMQVMPETAHSLIDMGLVKRPHSDVDRLSDPAVNMDFGCAYLKYLQRNLKDQDQVIAAYNAGLGAVQKWISQGGDFLGNVNFKETKGYISKVKDALEGYRDNYSEGELLKEGEK